MAKWPAKSWISGEFVTTQMMNDIRDELNDLHARLAPDLAVWTDVPFSASHFFAVGTTWTVTAANVVVNRWTQVGKTVTWRMRLVGSSMAGATAPYLYLTPPIGVAPPYFHNSHPAHIAITSLGQYFSNKWMWVDPSSGNLMAQTGAGFAPGTGLEIDFTVNYETP